MNVKQIRNWLALYPEDFELQVITETGPKDISPIGHYNAKECALIILPAEIIKQLRKGQLQ